MRRLPPLLSLLAATLLLMAVAFADGRPTVFYDSHSYDVMGRDLIEEVRDWPASVENKFDKHLRMGDWPVPTDRFVDPNVEGARSWFYGVVLHATYLAGGIWLLAALQSFLAAWVIYLLWRTLAPKAPRWSYLALVAAAVAGTSVSFFTTFAMPDIFAGIGGAAVVLLMAQGDRLRRGEIVGLWAVCAYSMAIHKSHWGAELLIALIGGVALAAMGLQVRAAVRRTTLVIAAAAVAWGAGVAANGVYEARTGYKLGHPPFVMARFLADGPGRGYMRYACSHGETFALCKYQQNVGSSTDLILWSNRKNLGVFNIADFASRQRLEREEMRFVLGVVSYDPVGQGLASMKNWGEQLFAVQVDDPLRNPAAYLRGRYWPTTMLPKLIPNFDACRPPGDCRPPFDFYVLEAWHVTVLVAGLALLVWRMSWRDVREGVWRRRLGARDDEPSRVAATMLLLTLIVLVNAGICGVLSGPFARYQSRLIWLLPLGAGLTVCALPVRLPALMRALSRGWALCLGVWERLRTLPAVGRFLPALDGHFARFCCVGGLGFVVDFAILKTVVHLGLSPIGGRWVSFSFAVVATWLVNRSWTFQHRSGPRPSLAREFSSYLMVQSVGFAANFAVYTGMVLGITALNGHLLPPMIAGTAAGLVINYLGAKHLVFRRAGAS